MTPIQWHHGISRIVPWNLYNKSWEWFNGTVDCVFSSQLNATGPWNCFQGAGDLASQTNSTYIVELFSRCCGIGSWNQFHGAVELDRTLLTTSSLSSSISSSWTWTKHKIWKAYHYFCLHVSIKLHYWQMAMYNTFIIIITIVVVRRCRPPSPSLSSASSSSSLSSS